MKVLLICALMAVCHGLKLELEWLSYKESFGKKYTNGREEMMRKNQFQKTYLENLKHNELFAAGKVSYEVGMNEFSDWTKEELNFLMPAMVHPEARANVAGFEYNSRQEVPDSMDWREKGAVTSVKRQGYCGSSYAFSAVGALEGALFLKKNKSIDLSEQNIIDCSQDEGNFGCLGGSTILAFEYVKYNFGINSFATYPYNANDNTCKFDKNDRAFEISGYKTVQGEDNLKQAVALKGPISVSISAEQLIRYQNGIIDTPCQSPYADQEALVVGYGSENGTDYWLVKNSWGHRWGEDGYFRMVRNKNLCSIGDYGLYPIA